MNYYGGTIMEYFDNKVLGSFMIPEDNIVPELKYHKEIHSALESLNL